MKYEVYHTDSLVGLSYHDSISEALEAIGMYERIDQANGTYAENTYDWRMDIGDEV